MLVLTRRPGEKAVIDKCTTVTVVEITDNDVRFAFDAPEHEPAAKEEPAKHEFVCDW